MSTEAIVACPKHMRHGPCGGVAADGSCELGDRPCPYVPEPLHGWDGPPATSPRPVDPFLAAAATHPVVLADLPEVPLDARSVSANAAQLAGHVDAVLFGDAGWARLRLPPSYRAVLVAREGVRPWAGLNCRDRNRVALESEVAALADIGAGIHCITGDHTLLGDRPEATPVFDLDSLELAAIARASGALVSVAENPVAPPIAHRPARVAAKAAAGAHVLVVNHAGRAEVVRGLLDGARALGADLPAIVCVPIVYSAASLALLRTFTGLAVPDGLVEAVESAPDPLVAGIDVALAYARSCLEIPGVIGFNLSATSPTGDEQAALGALVQISRELRG